MRFAAHYGFRPDFCQAADPESKGIVEFLVGYAKADLMVPPAPCVMVPDMGRLGAVQHPLQALSKGERVVIVGTGEMAAIAFEYFLHDTPHEIIAFSAEAPFVTSDTYYGCPVVPFEEVADVFPVTSTRVFVAVSLVKLNRVRRRLYHAVKTAGFSCISYVSSHAAVASNVEIGENTFVQEHVALEYGAVIGDNVYLGSGMSVGYRSVMEADSFSSANATVGNFCTVGRGSFIGAGSCVADGCGVAEDCVIGAGAVILKDTEARHVYLGNPARPVGRVSFETFYVQHHP